MKEQFLAKKSLKEFSQKPRSWERANQLLLGRNVLTEVFLVLLGMVNIRISAGAFRRESGTETCSLLTLQIQSVTELKHF